MSPPRRWTHAVPFMCQPAWAALGTLAVALSGGASALFLVAVGRLRGLSDLAAQGRGLPTCQAIPARNSSSRHPAAARHLCKVREAWLPS